MLAKKYRLPIHLFRRSRPKTFRGDYFTFKIFESNLPYSRAGVLVSKKVSKKATRRNKIKRAILRFVRAFIHGEKEKRAAMDILIIVSPSALGLREEEFLAELRLMFKKIK